MSTLFIAFDLEGPLSPQDNAYEVMKQLPNGDHIFRVISRYDDLVVFNHVGGKWRKRKNKRGREVDPYEAGDTLALIVPFLVKHRISESDIREVANRATFVDGAKEYIEQLKEKGWWVGDLTTCYEHYGYEITRKLGIPWEHVSCTRFPITLDSCRTMVSPQELAKVERVEEDILKLRPQEDDKQILKRLEHFYGEELQGSVLGEVVSKVRPLGGHRKLRMLKEFAQQEGLSLNQLIVVGDSITDYAMLEGVRQAGGIATAFNANEYALPYANVALASTNLSDHRLVTDAWQRGGRLEVERTVKQKEKGNLDRDRNNFHWLGKGDRNIEPILALHKSIRLLVRQAAAALG